MKKNFTRNFTMAITAIAIATALCGCPQSGNLACWLWNTDADTGVQTAYPVGNFSGIDAPNGAYFHFDGGKVDTGKSWVDYQVTGRAEPVRLNLVTTEKAEDGSEKCLSCTGHVVVGLIAIAGHTVPAIVDAVANAKEEWFDIVVPMGAVVETATLKVTTTGGDQFVVVLYGEASGITPPAENDYRLTVKVQGQGVVEVEALDENGVPYSVAEVSTSKVFDVDADSDVYFTAKPASGWRFEKWLVNGSSEGTTSNTEAMVTMEGDTELIAVFVEMSAPVDTTAPVITLNGSNPVNLTVGATWTDPGATATDAVDGVCVVSSSGSVNTGVAGTYTITYNAADRSGNQASATRTVVVSTGTTPTTPIVGTLSWNGNQLTASFTGATSSVFGFEIYQLAGSAPWVEREVWNVSGGIASGTVTKFRHGLNKTFRFENVTTATAGDGYVDPAKVSWSGSFVPTRVADAHGNVAWQITIP